ncbi:hypothetical protein ACWEFL_02740 [Streptomyces sp. NPDC004838]
MTESTPRPDYTRIAVLEHDLLDISPPPGSPAALIIHLRSTGTCLNHTPVATTTVGAPTPTALCARCGHCLINQDGTWQTATA